MDWGIISQATFFLSTALLAITATLYVLAISFLGPAIRIFDESAKRRELKAKERRKQSEALKHAIQTAKSTNDSTQIIEAYNEAIRKHDKFLEEIDEEIKEIDYLTRTGKALTIRGGLIYPSLCFLCSIILSVLGWSLSKCGSYCFWIGTLSIPIIPFIWFLAIVAMAFGLYRVYLVVKGIVTVAEQQ